MNNYVLGETLENMRNQRDSKLAMTNKRRTKLPSEPKYHIAKHFSEKRLAIEMNKANVKMKKPVFLGLLILEISKIVMSDCWHDYLKPKYGKKG